MIPYIDLAAQYKALKPEIDAAVSRVLASGRYIGGEEVDRFEESMARYLGVKHVVAVGNGYDALYIGLGVCGLRSHRTVIVDTYTHKSTESAVIHNGGVPYRPEDVSVNTDFYVVVHMNGRFNENAYKEVRWRDSYGVPPLPIVEDACQAIGASHNGRKAGTVGRIGCFSFHPMKVLSCAGDGGAIVTNDDALAEELRRQRNHGGDVGYGVNSRLDAIQAAILNVKLGYLNSFIYRRREIAGHYQTELPEWVKKPPAPSTGPYFDTYSSYVIGGSPELLAHLRSKDIECFSHIRSDVVSLPIYPEMPESHIEQVIAAVRSYG